MKQFSTSSLVQTFRKLPCCDFFFHKLCNPPSTQHNYFNDQHRTSRKEDRHVLSWAWTGNTVRAALRNSSVYTHNTRSRARADRMPICSTCSPFCERWTFLYRKELKNVCACVQLTLSGAFSIVWSMKVYPLEQCCSCGWFPGDYHFWQDGTWRILRTIQFNKKSPTYRTLHVLSRFVLENKFFRSCTPSKLFEKQFSLVKS